MRLSLLSLELLAMIASIFASPIDHANVVKSVDVHSVHPSIHRRAQNLTGYITYSQQFWDSKLKQYLWELPQYITIGQYGLIEMVPRQKDAALFTIETSEKISAFNTGMNIKAVNHRAAGCQYMGALVVSNSSMFARGSRDRAAVMLVNATKAWEPPEFFNWRVSELRHGSANNSIPFSSSAIWALRGSRLMPSAYVNRNGSIINHMQVVNRHGRLQLTTQGPPENWGSLDFQELNPAAL